VVYFIYVMVVCYCDVRKQKMAAIRAHRKAIHGQTNPVMIPIDRAHPSGGAYIVNELSTSAHNTPKHVQPPQPTNGHPSLAKPGHNNRVHREAISAAPSPRRNNNRNNLNV